MTRVKTPFISGTLLNNPLAIGETNMSSAALAGLATIASPDYAAIILDPAGSAGTPEVVWVTAHTAAATTATIARAMEGSTARQHLLAVPWSHGPTIMDFTGKQGTALASTATLTLPATDEDFFHVTGTTGITGINSRGAGKRLYLYFEGACLLTHSSNFQLFGGINYTTVAGDLLAFLDGDSNLYRQISGPSPQISVSVGSISRVGSNTAEQTTVSTSAVDLLTISSLSIPITNGIIIEGVVRTTAGAAVVSSLGLKLNATVCAEASTTIDQGLWSSSGANSAQTGGFRLEIMPRSANYLNNYIGQAYRIASVARTLLATTTPLATITAAFPNATITSITIRGISGNAGVILAVKEVASFEVKYS